MAGFVNLMSEVGHDDADDCEVAAAFEDLTLSGIKSNLTQHDQTSISRLVHRRTNAAEAESYSRSTESEESSSSSSGSRPTSISPIPPRASAWKRCHVEQLNIFYVPLEKSPYLQQPDAAKGDSSCFGYDYKALLQRFIRPGDVDWWNKFELTLQWYHIIDMVESHLSKLNNQRKQAVLLSELLKTAKTTAGKSGL